MSSVLPYVLAASSGLLVGYIVSVFDVLLSFVCYRCSVSSSNQVRILDQFFGKGYVQTTKAMGKRAPSDGLCFVWPGIIGVKKTTVGDRSKHTTYDLIIFGFRYYTQMMALLQGNSNSIQLMQFDQPLPWRGDYNLVQYVMNVAALGWQKSALRTVLSGYHTTQRMSIMIHGKPGTGKTELAFMIAQELKRDDPSVTPYVHIFNPTDRGLTASDVLGNPTADEPIILLINEWDAVIKHAESGTEAKGEGMSIAHNKTTLLNFLDRCVRAKHVIVVASMNSEPGTFDQAYFRRPRFDHVLRSGNLKK